MRIENTKFEDLLEILSLQKLAYQSEAEIYHDFSIPPLIQSQEQIEVEFRQKVFLKVVVKGKIIGSVRGYIDGGTCHIGRLIVHPDYQNKGIGSRLMGSLEERFPGVERYELFTGDKSERNLHLYQKLGYQIFKTQQLSDQVRLVYMEKWNQSRMRNGSEYSSKTQ